jgi:transcriptional regulator with XRE-family HTH domain
VFPKRLKGLREERDLLQKELADKLGISRATVASWEAGHRTPELSAAQRLADFFTVSVDYLLGRTDQRNPAAVKEASTRYDPRLADMIEGWEYASEHDKETISRVWESVGKREARKGNTESEDKDKRSRGSV